MLLIPAIDLKDGKCVRLRQGRMEDETVFSDDPLAMAQRWVDAGARRLHLVDLNGAFAGKPVNADVVHRIAEAFPEVPIEVGGGIRDEDTVQLYLDAGVQYVIIGTRAVSAPHFVNDLCLEFPGHILVGLDANDGKVAIEMTYAAMSSSFRAITSNVSSTSFTAALALSLRGTSGRALFNSASKNSCRFVSGHFAYEPSPTACVMASSVSVWRAASWRTSSLTMLTPNTWRRRSMSSRRPRRMAAGRVCQHSINGCSSSFAEKMARRGGVSWPRIRAAAWSRVCSSRSRRSRNSAR